MKILYITATPLEYNSSANMRNIALIKGLEELGNEVSTLSANFDKNSIYVDNIKDIVLKERYWIKLGNLQSNISNNIKEENKLRRKIKEKVYKFYTKLSIYDPKKRLTKRITEDIIKTKFDLIISSSDPKSSHLIAEKLIKLNPYITKKWIQYWGDPFIGDINKNTLIPEKIIKKEEERLVRICDKVVYVSPFTLKTQQEMYKKYKEKMIFIPIPYRKEKIYKKVVNEKISLGYFGDYNSKDRNIEPLYDMVSENLDLCLTICGNSDLKLNSKENIIIKPRQKVNVVEELEAKSDVLICICNRHGTQIPGKVYHYAATNKPILIIADGENKEDIKKYFESYNRFFICDNSIQEIKMTIKEIKRNTKDFIPIEELKPKNIAEKFLK